MYWYHFFSLISLGICLVSCFYHFYHLLKRGLPIDYSAPSGSVMNAVKYSFTGAMSPLKKESAFLHLPTYIAGIIFHVGTFLAIVLFFPLLYGIHFSHRVLIITSFCLLVSIGFGSGLFVKRMIKKGLRKLSNPDDFISNILVTLFQLMTLFVLYLHSFIPIYFVVTGLLWIYIPLGKLKHVVYFFAARVQLGFFFGWRGVWPPKKGLKTL